MASLFVMLALILVGATLAQAALLNIVNPGFELPGDIKHVFGFDAIGTTNDVPGWTNSGGIYTDEGVQKASGSAYAVGDWEGYMRGDNGGVYQITTNTMVPGVTYTLFCSIARSSTSGSGPGLDTNQISIISAPTTTTAFGGTTFLCSTTNAPTTGANVFANYTATYTAQPGDASHYIGIYVKDIGYTNAYMLMDDFRIIAGLIAVQPQSVNALSGDPMMLSVSVSNNVGNVTYQWKHGPVGGPYTNLVDAGNISGSATAVLTNSALDLTKDLGGYVVSVTDTGTGTNEISAEADVTSISNQLTIVNPGFETYPVPAKQNTGYANVPGWLNANVASPNVGARNGLVVYTDSGAETGGHSGAYEAYTRGCGLNNTNGSDGGAVQYLNYIIQPNDIFTLSWWAKPNTSDTNCWQTVTLFSCPVGSGYVPFTNCTVLAQQVSQFANNQAYTFFTLSYSNAGASTGQRLGIYFNTATNSFFGEANKTNTSAYVSYDDFSIVGSVLTILAQSGSLTNFANGVMTNFVIASSGNQPITYQWEYGPVGGPFTNLIDGGNVSGSATTNLVINPISTNNAGGYICHLSDHAGNVTNTTEADLTVLVMTNFYFTTAPPMLEYGAPGVSYQMTVMADYQSGTASNDVSSLATYSIGDPNVATINTNGGITVVGIDSGPTTVSATYLGTSLTQTVTLLQPTALWIVPSTTPYPPLFVTGPAETAKAYANFGASLTNVEVDGFNDPWGTGPGTLASQWASDNSSIFTVSGNSSGGQVTPGSSTGSANLSVTFDTYGISPQTASTNLSVASFSPLYQLLQNSGFELPATGKITWGYDPSGTNTGDVPYWMDANVQSPTNPGVVYYTDTGIEPANALVGTYSAYCRAGEGGGYQMVNYQMTNGDTIYLIWSAEHTGGNAGASTEMVSLISGVATNTPYTNCTTLASDNSVLPGTGTTPAGYTNIYIVYQATAADAGKYPGAYFNNVSAPGNNYCGFDNFTMAVKPLTTAPSAPVGITAVAGLGNITVSWTATGGATNYVVKRSTTSGAETTLTNVTTTSFVDSGVTAGVTNYYKVAAVGVYGTSANSVEVSAAAQASVAPNPVPIWNGSQLIINWSSGTLLETTNLITGTWVPVPGAAAPYYTNLSFSASPQMFYRVSVP